MSNLARALELAFLPNIGNVLTEELAIGIGIQAGRYLDVAEREARDDYVSDIELIACPSPVDEVICTDQNPAHLEIAAQILETNFSPEHCRWISKLSPKGEVQAVVVYAGFTSYVCEISVAAVTPRFLTRGFLRAVFSYPFLQLGLSRVNGLVKADNARALRLDSGIGMVMEATLKGWFGEKDGILMRMMREECKWIKGVENAETV